MLKILAETLESFGNLTPVPLLAIGLASGVILFSPDGFACTLSVDQFRGNYRLWIGLAFVASWCFLLAYSFWWGRGKIISAYERWRFKDDMMKSLHELTPDEKGYLLPYIRDVANTRYFKFIDGIAGGLWAKRILFRSSDLAVPNSAPDNLEPWARQYLQDHPELLGLD